MTALRVQTPGRLHFGLLGWGPDAPRQFGGVGLMIEQPGIRLRAESAATWKAEGPLAERTLRVAHAIGSRIAVKPVAFTIEAAPSEHVGLGVGTQLSLAVAQSILALNGQPEPSLEILAELTGRGARSGIGLHGFRRGGLIVDGGRGQAGAIPPLLAHFEFPPEWSILLVTPPRGRGMHGPEEATAFANLPPIPGRITEQLCRTVLLGLLPAVVERDLDSFGEALTELQERVGRCFAPAQGGIVAGAESAAIVESLRAAGLRGVGQSSWGPTLYGFLAADPARCEEIAASMMVSHRLGPESLCWTRASATGAAQELRDQDASRSTGF